MPPASTATTLTSSIGKKMPVVFSCGIRLRRLPVSQTASHCWLGKRINYEPVEMDTFPAQYEQIPLCLLPISTLYNGASNQAY